MTWSTPIQPHSAMMPTRKPKRDDKRLIIHFDYDCFYASVFEHENPALKSLPLAVQQKQIIVTCNYEARRRGLRKLQLISEAKKICPEVVIVLGEELGRFRDASKSLYKFLESFTWSGKVERLGFDEVFLDVTDIVDYNLPLLNPNDLTHSFFQLKQDDPTIGFEFDASRINGHTQPPSSSSTISQPGDLLTMRLTLGSHFAHHLRSNLEEVEGYTSTVGISTNKLLSKVVGNLNKPRGQTTLLAPYVSEEDPSRSHSPENSNESNVTVFIDQHDIGKIPGIGFKMAHRIRNHVLSRPAEFDDGLIWGETKESVTVRDVRLFPGMGPETLETILGGPGAERGIGGKVWGLINGIDDTEVQQMRKVPSQISIEDSYIRLDAMPQVLKELRMLATSLLKRMHTDLLEDDDEPDSGHSKRWIAHPKTVRLSTRARPPLNSDGTRARTFNRVSRSAPLPNFVFSLKQDLDIVEKLVQEALVPMFRRLHPQQGGWNLSLMNICVTNMVEAASEDSGGRGRDISKMFKRQEDVLKEWKVADQDVPPDPLPDKEVSIESPIMNQVEPSAGNETSNFIMGEGSEDVLYPAQNTVDGSGEWEEDEEIDDNRERCKECGALMPAFALPAHERFHNLEE